jgi:hypothetical protein
MHDDWLEQLPWKYVEEYKWRECKLPNYYGLVYDNKDIKIKTGVTARFHIPHVGQLDELEFRCWLIAHGYLS